MYESQVIEAMKKAFMNGLTLGIECEICEVPPIEHFDLDENAIFQVRKVDKKDPSYTIVLVHDISRGLSNTAPSAKQLEDIINNSNRNSPTIIVLNRGSDLYDDFDFEGKGKMLRYNRLLERLRELTLNRHTSQKLFIPFLDPQSGLIERVQLSEQSYPVPDKFWKYERAKTGYLIEKREIIENGFSIFAPQMGIQVIKDKFPRRVYLGTLCGPREK